MIDARGGGRNVTVRQVRRRKKLSAKMSGRGVAKKHMRVAAVASGAVPGGRTGKVFSELIAKKREIAHASIFAIIQSQNPQAQAAETASNIFVTRKLMDKVRMAGLSVLVDHTHSFTSGLATLPPSRRAPATRWRSRHRLQRSRTPCSASRRAQKPRSPPPCECWTRMQLRGRSTGTRACGRTAATSIVLCVKLLMGSATR